MSSNGTEYSRAVHPTDLSLARYRRRWLLASGTTALATALTWVVIAFHLPLNPVLFFLLATMASAFWGGYGPGVLAALLSVFVVPFLFVPGYSLQAIDEVRLVAFLVLSLVISWIRSRQLRAEALLRQANEELEDRVEERTRLLSDEVAERKRAQQALEASEQRFRALVEQSADGFALIDADGAVTYLGHTILGHDARSIIGKNVLDLLHPDDRGTADRMLEGVRQEPGAIATAEVRVLDAKGAWRWIEGAAKNALGVPAVGALILTYRDVTARREAELAHRERAHRLQLALEAGRMGTWEWDLGTDRVEWSEQSKHIYGLDGLPFGGTAEAATAFVLPEDRERLAAAAREAVDTGTPLHQEFRIIRADGESRWVHAQGQTLYDEARRPMRMVGVIADIHERKLGAEASAKLAAIVEHSDDAIVSFDLNGSVQTWNRGAERLYGYTAAEMAGRSISLLLPPEDRHQVDAFVRAFRTGRAVERLDAIHLRKDGGRVEVSLTASPICDSEGNLVSVSHVSRDITRQKRLEEQVRQKQKLESLGVLAGGIAHDFNNLLVGIMGNASLALEFLNDDDPKKPILEDVLAASSRSADLTHQLLAYAGKGRMEARRADLSALVQQTAKLVQSSLSKNVEVQLELDSGLPSVLIDPVQIQQVVMNLVINGSEAVPPEKHGVVRVATGRQKVDDPYIRGAAFEAEIGPGEYIWLEVSDNGSGMDEATKARIFDPFFTTKFTGRGLGLAAVLGIVRGHRGALQVYSEPGRGATFKVFLPSAGSGAEEFPDTAAQRIHPGSGTVLVIDDEPVVRNTARAALEQIGYRVLLAEHGRQGVHIHRAERDHIRAVILDWTMPVLGGEEALSEMRTLQPDLPVLLSSGFSETEALRRFNGLGVSGFLQKPYTVAQLAEKLQAVIGSS